MGDHDDGDHGVAPVTEDRVGALVMEIKKHVMMAISCHL